MAEWGSKGSFCNGFLFFCFVAWKGQNQHHHTRVSFPASPLATSAPYIQSEMLFSKELLEMIFLKSALIFFFNLLYCPTLPNHGRRRRRGRRRRGRGRRTQTKMKPWRCQACGIPPIESPASLTGWMLMLFSVRRHLSPDR